MRPARLVGTLPRKTGQGWRPLRSAPQLAAAPVPSSGASCNFWILLFVELGFLIDNWSHSSGSIGRINKRGSTDEAIATEIMKGDKKYQVLLSTMPRVVGGGVRAQCSTACGAPWKIKTSSAWAENRRSAPLCPQKVQESMLCGFYWITGSTGPKNNKKPAFM